MVWQNWDSSVRSFLTCSVVCSIEISWSPWWLQALGFSRVSIFMYDAKYSGHCSIFQSLEMVIE